VDVEEGALTEAERIGIAEWLHPKSGRFCVCDGIARPTGIEWHRKVSAVSR